MRASPRSPSCASIGRTRLDPGEALQYIDLRVALSAGSGTGEGERVAGRPEGRTRGRAEVLALILGACIALGYPPSPLFPLLFVGLAGFLSLIRGASLGRAIRLGLIFGLALEAGGFYWLAGTVARFYRIYLSGGEGSDTQALLLGIAAFIVWWLFAALAWGLWGLALVLGPRRPAARIAWTAVTLVTLEAFYPRVFPWNLGAGFATNPWLAQGAWWVGVAGLTAVAALIAAWIAEAFGGPPPGRRRPMIAAASLLAIWACAGGVRHHGDRSPEGTMLRIGFVQSAIPLERRHTRDRAIEIEVLSEIERRSRELLAAEAPHVVVWSEGMLPEVLAPRQFGLWVRSRVGGPIVIGGLGERDGSPTNRAYVCLDPDGRVEHYDKRHLVPFGEVIPFRGVMEAIGIPVPSQELASGEAPLVVTLGGVPVSFSICFEGILGVTAPSLRESGARLHLNLTEDLWYGDTSAPRQHLALTRMRVVESGLPLVRVTNGGISAQCDHRGRLLRRIELGGPVAGVFEVLVPEFLPEPPASQSAARWLPLSLPVLALLRVLERRRRPGGKPSGTGPRTVPPEPSGPGGDAGPPSSPSP